MKRCRSLKDDYPKVVDWIETKMEEFNKLFERCYQSGFREGRAFEVAECAKLAIIKSYKK